MEFRYMNDADFNVSYGLGVMPTYTDPKRDPARDTYPNYELFEIIGHAGADWCSGAQMVGYNFHEKISVVYTQATMWGMNCDLKEDDYFNNFSFE